MRASRRSRSSQPLIAITRPQALHWADNAEELDKMHILLKLDRYFQVGKSLPTRDRVELLLVLVRNLDVFVWSPYKVLGVDPNFIVHRLNMDSLYSPKK